MSYIPINQHESQFRTYETALQQIVSNYPNPSLINSTSAPSTMRQALRRALKYYINHPAVISVIPRDKAHHCLTTFIFSETDDGQVYIGPRRAGTTKTLAIASPADPAAPLTLPPIDVSSPEIMNAVFLLKNFDCIPLPLSIINLPTNIEDSLFELYPNIELVPTPQAGAFTLL